jgi:biotin carboxyl carrier protein
MKLALTVNGIEREMEIMAPPPACRFLLDGSERGADVALAEPGVYSILIDGRSYDAMVERTGDSFVVLLGGHRFEIEVRDPRRWSRKSALRGHGIATLSAPMPGKVVRVLVAAGDPVEAGQGVLVVEAMKMQNEMKAPRAGRVVSLLVQEGSTVTAGETLATIE